MPWSHSHCDQSARDRIDLSIQLSKRDALPLLRGMGNHNRILCGNASSGFAQSIGDVEQPRGSHEHSPIRSTSRAIKWEGEAPAEPRRSRIDTKEQRLDRSLSLRMNSTCITDSRCIAGCSWIMLVFKELLQAVEV